MQDTGHMPVGLICGLAFLCTRRNGNHCSIFRLDLHPRQRCRTFEVGRHRHVHAKSFTHSRPEAMHMSAQPYAFFKHPYPKKSTWSHDCSGIRFWTGNSMAQVVTAITKTYPILRIHSVSLAPTRLPKHACTAWDIPSETLQHCHEDPSDTQSSPCFLHLSRLLP
eukprot:1155078-Pelagomonas_calceolata.AAC.1